MKNKESQAITLDSLRVVLPGLEPGNAAPKTVVLPLHYRTILTLWDLEVCSINFRILILYFWPYYFHFLAFFVSSTWHVVFYNVYCCWLKIYSKINENLTQAICRTHLLVPNAVQNYCSFVNLPNFLRFFLFCQIICRVN